MMNKASEDVQPIVENAMIVSKRLPVPIQTTQV